MQAISILQNLSVNDFDMLCSQATERHYAADKLVFEEGDICDKSAEFFFVKSGKVSIFIYKYHRTEDISILNAGECFGEMGILNKTRRTASARALQDSTLLCLDRQAFCSVIESHPKIGEKVYALMARRNQELALKESILDSSGFNERRVHVSIKGDRSLSETVFDRERYKSIVDDIFPDLIPKLQSLLLERNVFRILINFNSGEVETYTIFNPFSPETHAANRLTSTSYLDRHFPELDYAEKASVIGSVYLSLAQNPGLSQLSEHWQTLFLDPLKSWQAVPREKIKQALSQLVTLRNLENYYLRNVSISTVVDVIRMQFNCDGTHIVSNDDYQRFLEENL